MENERAPDEMKKLWQGQSVEITQMSLEQIRNNALKFQRRISWRNGREYGAVVLIVLFFGSSILKSGPVLLRVGEGLCIAAGLYVAYQIYRRGSAGTVPADLGWMPSLAFHRLELERQRDLLRTVWSWYLGPMVPGLAVIMVAGVMANPGHQPHANLFIGLYGAVVGLLFYLIGRWNRRCAQRLQRQIDEIAAMEASR